MASKRRYIISGLSALIVILLFFSLQRFQEWTFFYREHHNLFLYDWRAIADGILSVGGFAATASSFIVQFFNIPYAGAAITAILASAGGFLLWTAVPKRKWSFIVLPFCFVPVLAELVSISEVYYSYQGFISFTIASIGIAIYAAINWDSIYKRIIAAVGMTALLFFMAGSAALLFSTAVLIIDWLDKRKIASEMKNSAGTDVSFR